jgi:hypothetical protein
MPEYKSLTWRSVSLITVLVTVSGALVEVTFDYSLICTTTGNIIILWKFKQTEQIHTFKPHHKSGKYSDPALVCYGLKIGKEELVFSKEDSASIFRSRDPRRV